MRLRKPIVMRSERFAFAVGVLATAVNAYTIAILLLPSVTSRDGFLVSARMEKHVRLVGEAGENDLILAMDGDCTSSCKRFEAFVVPRGQDMNGPEAALLILHDVSNLQWGKVGSQSLRLSFCDARVQHYAISWHPSRPNREMWRLFLEHGCPRGETVHLKDPKIEARSRK